MTAFAHPRANNEANNANNGTEIQVFQRLISIRVHAVLGINHVNEKTKNKNL